MKADTLIRREGMNILINNLALKGEVVGSDRYGLYLRV
jgi:hypothetical protein